MALVLSGVAHAAAFFPWSGMKPPMEDSMAGGAITLLDDLPSVVQVQGIADAEETNETELQPVQASEAVPVDTPVEVAEAEPSAQMPVEPPSSEPTESQQAEPVETDAVETADAKPVQQAEAEPTQVAEADVVASAEALPAEAAPATDMATSPSETDEPLTPALTPPPAVFVAPDAQAVAPVQAESVTPEETVRASNIAPMPRKRPEAPEWWKKAREEEARIARAQAEKRERERAELARQQRAQRGNTAADRSSVASGRASNNRGRTGNDGRRQTAGRFNSSNYAGRVMAHLRRHQRYPAAARRARAQGRATVRFTINSSGSVIGVNLARSSGHSLLDSEAVAMVRRASRFPPIPSGAGRNSMSFTAPISFRLR
ncbi:TonB family protein [Tepidamorphus sp. 3E244]|uniref:energy transducer TonB family protein n=1 Tax=Tepidamorphus sp. 3E244 TaxID=3385498 RepID=UPI0038FC250E